MIVTDHDTGNRFNLDMTEQLKSELATHVSEYHCSHQATEVRAKTVGGGATHFYRQCQRCGLPHGSALKKTKDLENCASWDANLETDFVRARTLAREELFQKHVRAQRDALDGYKREYDVYLSSPEWVAKRARVLKRANEICEGCLERKATQVHHLHYKHIMHEFMFELVAVCKECHTRLHAEHAAEDSTDDLEEIEREYGDAHICAGCRWQDWKDDRRWCGVLNTSAVSALAADGECGPQHNLLEGLK